MASGRPSPPDLSLSDEQKRVEIHAEEVDVAAAVTSVATQLLAFQNPTSVQESQSKTRFPMKTKIRKTVTVVRLHDDSDRNQKDSASAVKKHKIAESDSTLIKKNESTFTEIATNSAKSMKPYDTKSTKAMKENKSGVDSKTEEHKAFTDEAELVLLKGITDFVAKNGNGFMPDHDTFFEFENESFHGGIIKSHMMSKARKLKKKYNRYDLKVRNGEVLKPCQEKLYGLFKKIMSVNENVTSDVTAKLRLQRKEHALNFEKKESGEAESGDDSLQRLVEIVKRKLGFGCELDHELAIRGLSLMDKNKRMEMVMQWEILLRDESELNLRRIELVHEQGQLALAALKASSSL